MGAMGSVLSEPRDYPDISNGFRTDRDRLRGDVQTVTKQLNRQIHKEYGKQKYTA